MRIAFIDGTVTLNRSHPSLLGAILKLATPLTTDEMSPLKQAAGDTLVVWDDLGAGTGSMIAMSEGGEAAQPFRPTIKPVDAYNAALLDHVEIDTRFLTN